MTWYEIVINLVIGIVTGIVASLISNVFIERRIKKRDEYQKQLINSYLFFKKLESNFNLFSADKISNKLVECRILYSKDKELSNTFKKIDIEVSSVIRLLTNGAMVSFNFDSNEYLEFIFTLEKRINIL